MFEDMCGPEKYFNIQFNISTFDKLSKIILKNSIALRLPEKYS